MNQNLTIKQEYTRSWHTGPEMNSNAEGYIDSILAMNAPGRKSLVGHKNTNLYVVPHSFECLGTQSVEAVERLIDKLFVNDVPQLKKSEKRKWQLMLMVLIPQKGYSLIEGSIYLLVIIHLLLEMERELMKKE